MQLKASTDYGLRAVLYLAHQRKTCSSRDIAEAMSIPRDYLIQLAQLLRGADIVEARPGKNGGYRLAKEPSEISLLEVFEALDDDAKASRVRQDDRARSPMAEDVRRAYEMVIDSYDTYFSSITLDALLGCAREGGSCNELLASKLSEESARLSGRV